MAKEEIRLWESNKHKKHWKRWGPYLSERAWGTVREDYSPYGTAWEYLPFDHARSRAYRWNEDGLAGICDRRQFICFALSLWNEKDPFLKERMFGLSGNEGNHGEDVKEYYFYLDSTPTHSYMKYLYKYPQGEFPYQVLLDENRKRDKRLPEFELADTGVFDHDRYFDVLVEYAKAGVDDILIKISVTNRGADPARLHLLPNAWFRNIWSWGESGQRPQLRRLQSRSTSVVELVHPDVDSHWLHCEGNPELLFTENETNAHRLYGIGSQSPFVKDGINDCVVRGNKDAVNPDHHGTKVSAHYHLELQSGETKVVRLRLADSDFPAEDAFQDFAEVFAARLSEADEFYATVIPEHLSADAKNVMRQGFAGMLWSKQFYHYVVKQWIEGDPDNPVPPAERKQGRNHEWQHLYNADVVSMPDKWEYPWYAAWDLAFHCVPLALVDPEFAKDQLILLLREWYMHPNGQLPAYEWALGDVNPPVHAWAAWRVYKMTGPRGARDRLFLERIFQKLLLNFTWWVNRKDNDGNNLFAGGFLGLDNVGVFDRSKPLPGGGHLEQADGTAWMAFYCGTMLSIALELASEDPAYEDVASKFFEHFVAIADAMNTFGGSGLWDESDGFYYDQLHIGDRMTPMRLRSAVGLIPLLAVEVLEQDVVDRLPGFQKRLQWFLDHRQDLAAQIAYFDRATGSVSANHQGRRLLAIPSRERLERVLRV